MPFYPFRCTCCKTTEEKLLPMSRAGDGQTCKCGAPMVRLYSGYKTYAYVRQFDEVRQAREARAMAGVPAGPYGK